MCQTGIEALAVALQATGLLPVDVAGVQLFHVVWSTKSIDWVQFLEAIFRGGTVTEAISLSVPPV